MVVADGEQLARIAGVPKREFMRRGINQHTLEKISKKIPVRAAKLAKCLKVLEEYEAGNACQITTKPTTAITTTTSVKRHSGQIQ